MPNTNRNDGEWLEHLRKGKQDMARRCKEAAARIATEAGVVSWDYSNRLCSWASPRYVADQIQKAQKRRAKRIDPEARAWSEQ